MPVQPGKRIEMSVPFNTEFEPDHGECVDVAPGVRRVTANNGGPFTFRGTNTYLVGERDLAVIDPGPDDPVHLEALKRAIGDRTVSHILISHTHRDHSPAAAELQAITGAQIFAEGPHRAARDLHIGEINPLDASADHSFAPDERLADGALVEGDGWTLEAVATPGHTANHLAFALHQENILFSADHVMAWSTSIVAPPDGSMGDFMASLDKLLARGETLYLPGHGGAVTDPAAFMRGLKTHRKMRERAILDRLSKGDRTIAELVAANYRGLDERLIGAAALSTLAHLEDLVGRALVATDGHAAIDGTYRLAD
jgi:glyoxylase-like metal-dependent hydrolase (beta-lactamase superfamily II)